MRSAGFDLPERPAALADAPVAAWAAPIRLRTHLPTEPSRYPAFLDRRVYQGSSGRVYPLPFHDRIEETATEREWLGLHLENAHLRILVLPELGGRVQLALDRRTGYPLFYANPVIKPALVGLAGPWLAGGVEFNWPQHHRPATFLPTDWAIDWAIDPVGAGEAADEVTVWCSDHDPFARMKGMHGIRLVADSTLIELRVRLFNRTDVPQTFLWWANVAAEVHADYQSFFPTDVHRVADHARRAVSTFPSATEPYYGVDYPARRGLDERPDSSHRVPGDRLDWYRNVPVPTSYMCLDSTGDFFGGYDHRAEAGFVHWADHRIAVGKKQWTWGDAEFGHAWNRNLADDDSAYIELMAGVYTDNQPDFSHLSPGETKTFSQFWYPVSGTGPVSAATPELALGVRADGSTTLLALDATTALTGLRLTATGSGNEADTRIELDLNPAAPQQLTIGHPCALIEVHQSDRLVLRWQAETATANTPTGSGQTAAAVEPPAPADVRSVEELFLIGRHLQQYRHATRSPEPYWTEALRRDPGHAASHVALAARRYDQALFSSAEDHLRAAVARLTTWNANPVEGEAHHRLGLTLLRLGRPDEAYAAFAKAGWLRAWAGPAALQQAFVDARAGRDGQALERTAVSLRADPDQLQALALRALLLRRLGRADEAADTLAEARRLDRLDAWTIELARIAGVTDNTDNTDDDTDEDPASRPRESQTLMDVAGEFARAQETDTALHLLEAARRADAVRPLGQTACAALADYRAAQLLAARGDHDEAARLRARARTADRTWNFPSRLDDVAALTDALLAEPDDPCAAALLGHWLYAHDRPADAVGWWRRSVAGDPDDPVVWRNLALAQANHPSDDLAHRSGEAHPSAHPSTHPSTHSSTDPATDPLAGYDQALALAPRDAQLWYESDQLQRRHRIAPRTRLARLELSAAPVTERDDLSVEYAHLLISADRPSEALALLADRRYQPWEGGEGLVLRAWERAGVRLATDALDAGRSAEAEQHLRAALQPPRSIGEARHPLVNPAELLWWAGRAVAASGDLDGAHIHWRQAARTVGDFSQMATRSYSPASYFSVLSARAIGDGELARRLTDGLADFVKQLGQTPAVIDYFATSLPQLLLFDTDPQHEQDLTVRLISAQLALLDDDPDRARRELQALLETDPSHEAALDLSRRLDRHPHPGKGEPR